MKYLFILLLSLFVACGKSDDSENSTNKNSAGKEEKVEHLSWRVPSGWVKEMPSSSMRKAQFALPKAEGDPEDASVVVFYFQGQGGSVQANIERWYGQFEQPDGRPTEEVASVKKTTVNNLEQTIVDVSGTYLFQATPMSSTSTPKPNFRMLAAVIETDSGPWFVKLVGPEKTVEKWENSFYQFIGSIKE